MAWIDVTFERSGTLIKTIAKISAGWDGGRAYQFYGEELVDYPGDMRLRVAVWMNAATLLKSFPSDFAASYGAEPLRASIARGQLSLSVVLGKGLSWIKTSNGKPAIDWQPGQIFSNSETSFQIRHMIVFNRPNAPRGDYRAWDLLGLIGREYAETQGQCSLDAIHCLSPC